jgi:tetratricopeptide (TPR) repeat protein
MSASWHSKFLGVLCLFFVLSGTAWAQLCAARGKVIGEDGTPLKGAVIKFSSKELTKVYQVKTDSRGEYFHGGLPRANFRIGLEVDGKEVDHADNVQTQFTTAKEENFDLHVLAQKKAVLAKAAESGQFTKEQKREFSGEQRSAAEEQIKEQSKIAAKNKALADAFAAGRAALEAKQFDEATAQLSKAAEMAPGEASVWIYLAEAYVQLGDTKTGADRQAALEKGCDNFRKALAINPNDAVFHNKFALALTDLGRTSEAQAELEKAASLDPANAGKYFFNLGAMLTNLGQAEAAGAAYKKAIDADPNFAEAQFQYAMYLSSKMPAPGPDGKLVAPPGMKEALEQYLRLKPSGPDAEAATNLLSMIGTSLQTTYENPNKKPAKKH